MKNIINIVLILVISSCASSPGLTKKEVGPHYDKYYQELISNCKKTKGMLIENSLFESKKYYFHCEVTRERPSGYYRLDPFFGHVKGKKQMLQNLLHDYLIERFPYTEFKLRSLNDYHRSYMFIQRLLKSGYTVFSSGHRFLPPRHDGSYSKIMFTKIEGFSSNEYPTIEEIHGSANDVPKSESDKFRIKYRQQIKDGDRKNDRVTARTNRASRAQIARWEAERKAKSAPAMMDFGFINPYKLNAQDQQFINALNKNSKLIESQAAKRFKKRSYKLPRKKTYSPRYSKQSSSTRVRKSFSSSYNSSTKPKSPGRAVVMNKTKSKKVDISRISCVAPYVTRVEGVHGFYMLKGGSIAAGGPYCEHFSPRKGVRDCSGHKKRHAEDFKLRGKKHCEKLRNGMTYIST